MATANFEYIIQINRLIYFQDKSVDAISWHWTIDGNEFFEQFPTYTFPIGGPKDITLIINEGELDETQITRTIHVPTFTTYQNASIDDLRIRSFPPEVTFQWYKKVGEINTLIDGATSRVYDINSISPDNEGDYFCRVTNIKGYTDSNPATVTVRIKPYFYDVSESQTVGEGDEVILHAYADGIPTQLYYQWYKNGEAISDVGKYSGTQTDTLTITDIDDDEEGNYTCKVTNDLSQEKGTNNIEITVETLDPFNPSYWACTNAYSFDPEDGITQLFNDTGAPYAVRYISNVAGLTVAYTCNWTDGGTVSSSGAVCYNGIGIKPLNLPEPICSAPGEIDGIGAYGAWQLRTFSCFSNKTVTFIGRNNEFSTYYSGCILDTEVNHTTNILLTVGEDKGGNYHDVTIHLIVDGGVIDEEHVLEDIYFGGETAQLMIGGMLCGSNPASAGDWSQHITQLDILEAP